MSTVSNKNRWIYRCIVVLVIATHALVLSQLTGLLSQPATVPTAFSDTVFNTRTIEVAPPPSQVATASTPQVITAAKSVKTSPRPNTSQSKLPIASNTDVTEFNSSNQTLSDDLPTDELPAQETNSNNGDAAAAPTTTPETKQTTQDTSYAVPASAILKYNIKGEIKGFSYFANGQLSWQHNGSNYDAQLEISHFLLGSRTQTSSGQIGERGLVPLRFADKVRTEVVAQLDHGQKQVTFKSDASNAPLQDDAQDQLSIFIQLSSLLAGNPQRYKTGDRLPFQAVGARSSEQWIFEIGKTESLTLPGGTLQALQLTRNPPSDGAPKVEVWLAPSMQYLPVRIRLTQGDGDFVEQEWRSIKKP